MYCNKCGNEIKEGAKFCNSCGSHVNNTSADMISQNMQSDAETKPVKKSSGYKKFLIGTLVVIALIFVWAFADFGSLSVSDVKKSQLNGYDNLTIGKAFDEYFDDTSWEAFKTESGIAVVEFQGTFDYKGPTSETYASRATVQFAQDPDVSTDYFYVHSIKIDITDKNAPSYMADKGYFLDDNMGSDFIDAVFYNTDFEDWIFGP